MRSIFCTAGKILRDMFPSFPNYKADACDWCINSPTDRRGCVRTQVYQIQYNNAMQRILRRSRSFKVTDFGTNRKLIYDFLLVINTNLPPVLHRFQVMADYWSNFR